MVFDWSWSDPKLPRNLPWISNKCQTIDQWNIKLLTPFLSFSFSWRHQLIIHRFFLLLVGGGLCHVMRSDRPPHCITMSCGGMNKRFPCPQEASAHVLCSYALCGILVRDSCAGSLRGPISSHSSSRSCRRVFAFFCNLHCVSLLGQGSSTVADTRSTLGEPG